MGMQVLTQRLQLDSEVKTSDLLEQATQLLGAVPILTCYYRGNTAYLNSVSTLLLAVPFCFCFGRVRRIYCAAV